MLTEVRQDSLPGCNYIIWQSPEVFCFTTDAVFLAAFPHLVQKARVLELGCGTGAISLLLAYRGAQSITALDINPDVVELLERSIASNGLEQKVKAQQADVKDCKKLFAEGSFDLVAANPPYRIGGKKRLVGRAACHEEEATLEEFIAAASYAVKNRGRVALVQLPERFVDAVRLGIKYGLELKKLQWVHASVEKRAWIFLAEFVKGGKPGLEVLPPLVMYNADGTHSKETLAYYAMQGEEEFGGRE